MKVVLDLDRLLANGHINAEEYERFQALAAEDTGSLAFNVLVGFGVVATALGALALVKSSMGSIGLGVGLGFGAITLQSRHARKWGLLSAILLLVGALMVAGGLLVLTSGSVTGFAAVTAVFFVAGLVTSSGLLASLSAFALAATVGATSAYGHAMYMVAVEQPTLTVVLFGVLALATYRISLRSNEGRQRFMVFFARTSLFLVNMGFWIGSLWGDRNVGLDDELFVVAWAIALVATGVWAWRANRRWVVNLVVVFGAIHFYTQYFERLGANPRSILFAGLMALGIAVTLVKYNARFSTEAS